MNLSASDLWWILLIVAWDLVWKGLALWRSAQRKQTGWFVALLIVNSAGVLPIIYLLTNNGRSINIKDKQKLKGGQKWQKHIEK